MHKKRIPADSFSAALIFFTFFWNLCSVSHDNFSVDKLTNSSYTQSLYIFCSAIFWKNLNYHVIIQYIHNLISQHKSNISLHLGQINPSMSPFVTISRNCSSVNSMHPQYSFRSSPIYYIRRITFSSLEFSYNSNNFFSPNIIKILPYTYQALLPWKIVF